MKQPEDKLTIDLLDGAKRGRGRPPKADALTSAQRQKRYRDNLRSQQREQGARNIRDSVTNITPTDAGAVKTLTAETARLRMQLELAEAERNAAMKEVAKLKDRRVNTAEVGRCMELQTALDLEHLARIDAETKLASLEAAMHAPKKPNPLAATVTALKADIRQKEALIRELRADVTAWEVKFFSENAKSVGQAPAEEVKPKAKTRKNYP